MHKYRKTVTLDRRSWILDDFGFGFLSIYLNELTFSPVLYMENDIPLIIMRYYEFDRTKSKYKDRFKLCSRVYNEIQI